MTRPYLAIWAYEFDVWSSSGLHTGASLICTTIWFWLVSFVNTHIVKVWDDWDICWVGEADLVQEVKLRWCVVNVRRVPVTRPAIRRSKVWSSIVHRLSEYHFIFKKNSFFTLMMSALSHETLRMECLGEGCVCVLCCGMVWFGLVKGGGWVELYYVRDH